MRSLTSLKSAVSASGVIMGSPSKKMEPLPNDKQGLTILSRRPILSLPHELSALTAMVYLTPGGFAAGRFVVKEDIADGSVMRQQKKHCQHSTSS
ncbi:hypothetical protein L6172_14990 [Thalassospiraceae bacterium SW-3-3]|nr:hypothetical protein L6172_14990 [Thalassospiraceae bacterium SW-3-3]